MIIKINPFVEKMTFSPCHAQITLTLITVKLIGRKVYILNPAVCCVPNDGVALPPNKPPVLGVVPNKLLVTGGGCPKAVAVVPNPPAVPEPIESIISTNYNHF